MEKYSYLNGLTAFIADRTFNEDLKLLEKPQRIKFDHNSG